MTYTLNGIDGYVIENGELYRSSFAKRKVAKGADGKYKIIIKGKSRRYTMEDLKRLAITISAGKK